MGASGWTHLDVKEIKGETEKAFKLNLKPTKEFPAGRLVWVPKSVMSDPDNYDAGDKNCTISVEDWFAEKEKLEGS